MDDRQTGWIAGAVAGRTVGTDTTVTGPVVTDSREAAPGSLYVARRGESADGHDFVAAARRAGAVCAIVEHEVPDAGLTQVVVEDSTRALGDLARAYLADLRAHGRLDVTAITGSAGKTTTKDLLAQVLRADAPTVWPVMSFNNEVGVPLTVLRADASTRHLVVEMGASGPGHLTYLTHIAPPDVAVELMVGRAHLGGFGSREALARAKAELVDGLRPGGTAVLNADDPRVAAMATHTTGPVVRFSTDPAVPADVHADAVALDEGDHASFTLRMPDGSAPVVLGLVGLHHVHNALAAAAAAHVLGLAVGDVARGLTDATALSPHRMAVTELDLGGRRVTLLDDSYNANPDSMRAGLAALRSLAGKRREVAVLGGMLELGPGSEAMHEEVGRCALDQRVAVAVAVGPGSGGYLAPLAGHARTVLAEDDATAVDLVEDVLEDGDVVLVKGSNGSGVWRIADRLQEMGGTR